MARRFVTVPMILFYLVMGLSSATILVLLGSTKVYTELLIFLLVALLVAIVATSSIMLPEFTGAPWVPISSDRIGKILSLSELKQNELLYDLGSGDGRIVIAAAKEVGARAAGVEIDPIRVFYSRLKVLRLGLKDKVRIVRRNFFNVELADADVVVVFLLQETLNKLRPKLERELKPSCRVVSIVFRFDGWEVIRADEEEMIFVYKPRPAKSAGSQ